MLDDWTASVSVLDAGDICVTVACEQPAESSAQALIEACGRLTTAFLRSNGSTESTTVDLTLGARCQACISLGQGSKLNGVFADLAGCSTKGEASATRILHNSSAPSWHVINALALELDPTAMPAVLENGATLVHVLEVRSGCPAQHGPGIAPVCFGAVASKRVPPVSGWRSATQWALACLRSIDSMHRMHRRSS